jgi:2-polyprenyl-3-methyl-5-hydroxy-6-metoxy-1,4-benzoquinol methylase
MIIKEMQAIDNKKVAEFYDKFWADLDQKKLSGINSRHRYILYHLKKAGLRKDSKVLEIGCGLGMLTHFISRSIPSGRITGVDISPESIEYARKKYGSRNISFYVNDMTDFKLEEKFDFIVFPDVLEHIPVEAHANIFRTIRRLVHSQSTVLINIPEPLALEYMHIHFKSELQIIDQPLHTYPFLKALYENGFYLFSLKTYSVFYEEPDYQSLVVKPYEALTTMKQKGKFSVFLRSVWLRIMNFIN